MNENNLIIQSCYLCPIQSFDSLTTQKQPQHLMDGNRCFQSISPIVGFVVWNTFQSRVTVVVSGVDAGENQTLVGQTGCGDGSHWGGQRLAGRTAACSLVVLKKRIPHF